MRNYIASLKEDFKVPSKRLPNLHIGGELAFIISFVSTPYLAFVFGARGGLLFLSVILALIAALVMTIAAEAAIRRSAGYDYEEYEYDPEGITEEIPILSSYRSSDIPEGYEEAA